MSTSTKLPMAIFVGRFYSAHAIPNASASPIDEYSKQSSTTSTFPDSTAERCSFKDCTITSSRIVNCSGERSTVTNAHAKGSSFVDSTAIAINDEESAMTGSTVKSSNTFCTVLNKTTLSETNASLSSFVKCDLKNINAENCHFYKIDRKDDARGSKTRFGQILCCGIPAERDQDSMRGCGENGWIELYEDKVKMEWENTVVEGNDCYTSSGLSDKAKYVLDEFRNHLSDVDGLESSAGPNGHRSGFRVANDCFIETTERLLEGFRRASLHATSIE